MIATDAVGMGLNLNIKRIVFSSVTKFDGKSVDLVSPSQIKQIAGRAGRAKSQYPEGEVTTLHDDDHEYLHYSMKSTMPKSNTLGIFPSTEQLELFASELESEVSHKPNLSTVIFYY